MMLSLRYPKYHLPRVQYACHVLDLQWFHYCQKCQEEAVSGGFETGLGINGGGNRVGGAGLDVLVLHLLVLDGLLILETSWLIRVLGSLKLVRL